MKKESGTWERRKKKHFFFSVGILVNGQLIGAKKPNNGKLSTYFGKLGFYFQTEDMKIEISTETITMSRGSHTSILSWSDTAQVISQRQVSLFLHLGLSLTHYINHSRYLNVNIDLKIVILNMKKLRFKKIWLPTLLFPAAGTMCSVTGCPSASLLPGMRLRR